MYSSWVAIALQFCVLCYGMCDVLSLIDQRYGYVVHEKSDQSKSQQTVKSFVVKEEGFLGRGNI